MYFYDVAFYDNKIVFPEYMVSQIVVLNENFTIDTIIFDESYYGRLFWGIYVIPDGYIISIYNSRVIRKYLKDSKLFVDVDVRNLPAESKVHFRHNEVFEQEDKVIIITSDNDLLLSDLLFSEIKYIKKICNGKRHKQIAEDNEFLYIPIEGTIFCLSKNSLDISLYAQFEHTIDVLFRNKEGLWVLTNDAQLIGLDKEGQIFDLSKYIHFYGDRQKNQINNYVNAYCYQDKVLLVPCYCDNLLLLDTFDNQITELTIEKEIEDDKTLNKARRKNVQKYIASCQKDNRVLFLSSSSEIVYLFDFETSLITELPKGITKQSVTEIKLKHERVLEEDPTEVSLMDYVEYIVNK